MEAGPRQAADTCGCEDGKIIPNEDNFRTIVLFWQGSGVDEFQSRILSPQITQIKTDCLINP
jgi:hypothetical protein